MEVLGSNNSVEFTLKGAVHEETENEGSEGKDSETMVPIKVEPR